MSTPSLDTTVGALVTERPARSAVFERLGIDYCCGGRRTLRDACLGRGLDPDGVLQALEAAEASAVAEDSTDWSKASLSALVDHIVTVHHAYLREALPRMAFLTEKVARAHGERHPELVTLQHVVESLHVELELHMAKEERVLFPFCKTLETARTRQAFHCGSVANPIRAMTDEHENTGRALYAIRELTDNFTPPADACNTYRALLDGLAELERDLHRHIHKENNILFPRAAGIEAALASAD